MRAFYKGRNVFMYIQLQRLFLLLRKWEADKLAKKGMARIQFWIIRLRAQALGLQTKETCKASVENLPTEKGVRKVVSGSHVEEK